MVKKYIPCNKKYSPVLCLNDPLQEIRLLDQQLVLGLIDNRIYNCKLLQIKKNLNAVKSNTLGRNGLNLNSSTNRVDMIKHKYLRGRNARSAKFVIFNR